MFNLIKRLIAKYLKSHFYAKKNTPSENRTRNSDVKTGPLRHIVVKVSYQKEKNLAGLA